MGILDVAAGKESQLVQAAIFAYSRNDIDGAIGFIKAQNRLLNPPVELPAMPIVLQNGFRALHNAKVTYFFKIMELVNDATRVEYIKVRKHYAGPARAV